MTKENLFPKLIGWHSPKADMHVLIGLNESGAKITAIQKSGSNNKKILQLKGEKAIESIKELNHMCWGGMSPNQAIEKWLSIYLKG